MTDDRTSTTAVTEQTRRLTRRDDGKMLAGVCSGLGAYFGVDPVLCRIGFVVLTVVTIIGGPLAYGALWLVMPRSGEPVDHTAPAGLDTARSRTWLGLAALVGGAVLLVHQVWDLDGTVVLGILAIGIGVALWSGDARDAAERKPSRRTPGPPEPPATEPTEEHGSVPAVPPPAPPTPAAPGGSVIPPPPPRRRERSYLGRLVAGTVAIVAGVLMVLDAAHVARIDFADGLAWGLLVIGAGLVAGAWWGRARWLIGPGIVIALALVFAQAFPAGLIGGGVGDVIKRPTAVEQLAGGYRLTAGELIVDLTELELEPGDDPVLDARVGFGQLAIIVPDDLPVIVNARINGGEIDVFGRVESGLGRESFVTTPGRPDDPRLTIEASVGFGEIIVRRASTAPSGWLRGEIGDTSRRDRDSRIDIDGRGVRVR